MKTKRKWIDLTYSSLTSLRAEDIPFDATSSIKDAIQGHSILGPMGATGLQGPGIGDTGIQGLQGPTGLGDLQPGETGLQGPQGVTGLQGIKGSTGLLGVTGFQGVTGFVVPGSMPSTYTTLTTPTDVVSASFVDVISSSLTLDSASEIFATMSYEVESAGAGSYPTGAFRVIISPNPTNTGDSTGIVLEKYLLPDDVSIGTVDHYDGNPVLFPAATYTIKGQAYRVSGQQKIRINNIQLYAHSLRGGKGDIGPAGQTGINGLGVTGLQGLNGATGLYGPTGLQGPTGFAFGVTGLKGDVGQTGLQGLTGIHGLQGVTGISVLVSPPSSFVYFDSTAQLYDNTSSFIDIPGLSTPFTVDASGAYSFSTMTILADSTSSPMGSGYVEAAMRIVIDDQTSLEYNRYVQSDFDLNSNTITFRADPLSNGVHTAKGQIKIVSSDGDNKFFRVQKAQLFVEPIEGSAGPIGPQGLIGVQGITGFQGPTGVKGFTGIQGLAGQTGLNGVGQTGIQGIVGPVGPQGDIGLSGSTGLNGPTGIRGLTGVQGLGQTGILGLQGVTGIYGQTGLLGLTGIQGFTGLALGSTGLMGPTGILGVDGRTGIQGFTGLALGATGLMGPTGILGSTGIQGLTGLLGLTGFYGQTGLQGFTGFYGQTGLLGQTGLQGLTGFYGQTGLQGLTGFYGQTGLQGLTGFYGQTGLCGQTGLQGVTGIYGQTGLLGQTGVQGLTGFYGKTGVQGVTGLQGLTGFYGQTGIQGFTGFFGQTGIQGTTGLYGQTGVQGFQGVTGLALGATGIQGVTGFYGRTGIQGITGISTFMVSRNGSFFNTNGIDNTSINIMGWNAPFNCTVNAVKGYKISGTGATINTRKNGSLTNLVSNLFIGSDSTWLDGGSVQNTSFVPGDTLEFMLIDTTGYPTQVAVQVNLNLS